MKKIFLPFFVVLLFGMTQPVHAETTVTPDKEWTITFNTPIDLSSAEEAVKVENSDGEATSVKVEYGESDKQIIVEPKSGTYKEGAYELTVGKEIRSLEGIQATSETKKAFTISKDAWPSGDQSVKEMSIQDLEGEDVSVHLLADQPLPEQSASATWSDNRYQANFAIGIETEDSKKEVELTTLIDETPTFYQNAEVNVDWQFRKLDDHLFVLTQMMNERFTLDYYFAVEDGEVTNVPFHINEETSLKTMNDKSHFKPEEGDTYIQRIYSDLFERNLKTQYVFDEEEVSFTRQQPLAKSEIASKATQLQDKVRNIMYTSLQQDIAYEDVRPKLDPYVTDEMDALIEAAYQQACLDCGMMYFNKDWQFNVKSLSVESYQDRAIIQTFIPDTTQSYGGLDWITLKQEGDHWKLDDMMTAYFSKDLQLDLTKEEAKTYLEETFTTDFTYEKTYQTETKDYAGNAYTTNIHQFTSGDETYKVDASTAAISQ